MEIIKLIGWACTVILIVYSVCYLVFIDRAVSKNMKKVIRVDKVADKIVPVLIAVCFGTGMSGTHLEGIDGVVGVVVNTILIYVAISYGVTVGEKKQIAERMEEYDTRGDLKS